MKKSFDEYKLGVGFLVNDSERNYFFCTLIVEKLEIRKKFERNTNGTTGGAPVNIANL